LPPSCVDEGETRNETAAAAAAAAAIKAELVKTVTGVGSERYRVIDVVKVCLDGVVWNV
jgi:hypothetical protein